MAVLTFCQRFCAADNVSIQNDGMSRVISDNMSVLLPCAARDQDLPRGSKHRSGARGV